MDDKNYKGLQEAYNSIYEAIDRPPGSTDKPPYGLKADPRSTKIVQDLFAKPENKTQTQSSTTSSSTSSTSSQTVAVAGGKGGTVTVGKQYPATLGGKPVNVSYDASGKRTVAPVTSQSSTTTASPSSTSSTATLPATPKKTFQQELDDLRKASAQATMAGPSKEAQALMSTRAKNILGPEKLRAGIEGQQRVEKMKSEIGVVAPKPQAPTPPAAASNRQPTPPPPPKTSPGLTKDQLKQYNQATSALQNPLTSGIAKGRVKDTYGKMNTDQQKVFKDYLKTRPKSEQDLYKFLGEQQIGIPLDEPTDAAAVKKLREILPAREKDKIYIPKSALQKASYEYEDLYDEVLDYLINEGYSEEESKKIMVENILNLGQQVKNLKTAAQMFRYMAGIDKMPVKPPAGPANLGNIALRRPSPTVTPKPKFQIGTPPKSTPPVKTASSGIRPGVGGTILALTQLQGDTPQSRTPQQQKARAIATSQYAARTGQFGRYGEPSSQVKPAAPKPKPEPVKLKSSQPSLTKPKTDISTKPKPVASENPDLKKYDELRKSDPAAAKELGMKIWSQKYKPILSRPNIA